jgi:hypothetical protein
MDEFKKYLKQREPDMNVDEPGDEVWQRVQSKMAKRRLPVFMKYAVAACLLVIAGAAIFFLARNKMATDIAPELVKNTDTLKQLPLVRDPDTVTIVKTAPSEPTPEQDKTAVLTKTKKRNEKKSDAEKDQIALIGNSYNTLISYQMERLRRTPVYAERPAYFTEFASQLKTMDRDEVNIRKDIKLYGLNDQLLEQLINVYQQKLNVLKSLRTEINKMNNSVKKNDHPLMKQKPYYLTL